MKTLFAYMTKSEKKYADPTKMIRNIVDDFGNQMKIGDQQDISEVSEGFMTRLHEGFQAIANPYPAQQEKSPFDAAVLGEEEKVEDADEGSENSEDSNRSSSISEDLPILERVEKYTKNEKDEGFIKDLFYGKQVETTE